MSIEVREWMRKAIVVFAISVALPWGSMVKGAANDDRSYYIDRAGKPIIEKGFSDLGDFDGQGLAAIKLDDPAKSRRVCPTAMTCLRRR